MHSYKLRTQNESELVTTFHSGMRYMLEPNFIFYLNEYQPTTDSLSYNNYLISQRDIVYLGECNTRWPQSTRYSFKTHPDPTNQFYNHVQQHGMLVDIIDGQIEYNHIVRIQNNEHSSSQSITFNIGNLEPWAEGRWTNQTTLGDMPTELTQLITISREQTMPTETEWTESRTRTIYMKEYLAEQIRSRYAFLDRPTSGLSNVIVDSFFPRLMYAEQLNTNNITSRHARSMPSTAVAISPFVASVLNVKQMETEQLCRILGYDKKHLKRLMNAVKSKQYKFAFIGAGGTGINTAHWLAEISKMVNVVGLFSQVFVYENDNIEISNLIRFPKDISQIKVDTSIYLSNKMQIISSDVNRLSKLTPSFNNQFIASGESMQDGSYPYELFKTDRGERDTYTGQYNPDMLSITTRTNTILYGAPDIQTRANLSKCGSFISATHAATNCYIYLNPKQDQDLQVETYGMIQLAPFFMNQLKMAITLLEILGQTDLNLSEQDVELLNYQFTGTNEMTTDRQYNWQYEPDAVMLTEEESLNV